MPYYIIQHKIGLISNHQYSHLIVFQKVCKSHFYYFCNGSFKNDRLWNLHMNKFRK
jgi:hypothetical protein